MRLLQYCILGKQLEVQNKILLGKKMKCNFVQTFYVLSVQIEKKQQKFRNQSKNIFSVVQLQSQDVQFAIHIAYLVHYVWL